MFLCKYLFICLINLVSAISIQSIWIIHNGFFLLPFHFFSSNSYIPYLILETVEIAKTAGFNNDLYFLEYIFFSIFTGYWLNHVQRKKRILISIHDHQLTSSYRDQVYFAGMRWQREAQNHKLPFAWFTPLGTGSSVGGAVKVQILFNCGGIAVIPLIDFHLNYEMIDAPRQFCQYHSRWEESWDCFFLHSYRIHIFFGNVPFAIESI